MGHPYPQDTPSPGIEMGGEAGPYQASTKEAFQGPLDRFITPQSLSDMHQWLSGRYDGVTSSLDDPRNLLSQINRNYPNGVRGFLSDNDPSFREANPPMPTVSSWKGEWRVAAEAPKGDLGAIERKSVDVGSGPEPKMDKKEWKPNALNEKGNLKPVDTDMDGTRHPTVHQDIAQVPDHSKDFREQTRAGETRETLKGTDSFDGSGFNKEKNITQYPTRTFGDKGQQPSGVGQDAFPKASAASETCPNCGANPDSETRCSVCKGWASAHEGSQKVAKPYDPNTGDSWGDPLTDPTHPNDFGFTSAPSATGGPYKVHTFNEGSGDAYDYSQSHGGINHGDILHVPSENTAAILHRAWPISVDQNNPGSFERFEPGKDWGQGTSPEYDEHLPAVQEARSLLNQGGGNPSGGQALSSTQDPDKNPVEELLDQALSS
jgi:hypothetical protein